MEATRKINADTNIFTTYFPFPGYGLVPVNAFVIKAQEPVLVDTSLMAESDAFLEQLGSVIDPMELRWLFLTHPDADHTGSLRTLMEQNPKLRLVTTYLGYGILSLTGQIGLDRVYLLNPGESLDVGDRQLVAIKPPIFDNPATTGFLDTKTRTLFSSDCFGALVQSPFEAAEDISADDLRQGQTFWATIDAPWLHRVDHAKLGAELNKIRALEPAMICSSHLPPARSLTDTLLATAATAPDAEAFLGPNQAALEAMLVGMTA